jgi:hypothetical protein
VFERHEESIDLSKIQVGGVLFLPKIIIDFFGIGSGKTVI